MDFYYYVRIRFREKHKNGEHRDTNLRVKARNSTNAARRAVRQCVDAARKDIISIRVDDLNKVPVSKRLRKKYLEQKLRDEQQRKDT